MSMRFKGAGAGTSVNSVAKSRDYYLAPKEQPKKQGRSSSNIQQPDTLLAEWKML